MFADRAMQSAVHAWAWSRARTVLRIFLFLLLAERDEAHAGATAIRFVDKVVPPAVRATNIDGIRRRVLDPYKSEHAFPLDNVPALPVLSFSIGRRPFEGRSAVRFEIWLRQTGKASTQLYGRELDHPGWIDERLDLSAYALDGSELVFLRTRVEGTGSPLFQSLWGDPVLVSNAAAVGPSVILISLDTLRADRLGIYGNSKAHTPTLDALARAGVWYTHASSPSTWTYPSHQSLFFGLRPALQPCPDPSGPQPKGRGCPDHFQPLAEIYRQAGFVTAGFTGGGYLSNNFGFSRGTDTYYMFPQPASKLGECQPDRLDGREVFPRAMQWLRDRGRSPFFLFVHTYDPHDRCQFRTDASNAEKWGFTGADGRQRFLDHYDQLISDTDAKVGELLQTLEAIGAADSTLVVVTSDHGEGLDEHGFKGHGCPLKPYEELVHVPLIMRWPKRVAAGTRIDEPVSLVDVAPSMLALTNTPSSAPMEGVTLPGLNLPTAEKRPAYVHCDDFLSVRRGKHKLITSRTGAFPDELYDLEADAGETTSRLEGEQAAVKQLRQDAAAYWQKVPASSEHAADSHIELDSETKERLRALGYQ